MGVCSCESSGQGCEVDFESSIGFDTNLNDRQCHSDCWTLTSLVLMIVKRFILWERACVWWKERSQKIVSSTREPLQNVFLVCHDQIFFFFFKGFTTFKHVESVNFSLACSKLWFYFAFHLLVLTHYKTFHIFHKLNTHFPFRHLIPFLAICSSTCDWIKSVWFACLNKTKTQLHLSN